MNRPPPQSYWDYLKVASKCTGCDPLDFDKTIALFEPYVAGLFPALPVLVFLLDFSQKQYLFMSQSSRLVLGYPAEYVMDGGLEFICRQYKAEDFRVYSEKIFVQNLHILRQRPAADHSRLMFGYNYRFLNKDGEYHTLMQKSVMLRSAPDGSPITMLSFAFDISDYKSDSKIIHTVEAISDQGLVPLAKNFYFPHLEDAILSRRETEILKWICDGLSSKEIAGKLHLSLHTVNNHRKNMLQKCNCKNATELLVFSIREGLI